MPINAIRPGDIVEVEDPLVGTLPIAEKVRKAGRKLFANAGSVQDIRNAMKAGADGIGLFRTEFLFLSRPDMPSEEEQEAIYRNAIEACNGKPLTIRLLDAGGDKALPWHSPEQEDNPFLGVRGIRLLLANPEILRAQIRAILRAAADTKMTGETRIMIPMVTRIDEVRTVRDMVSSESELLEDVNGSIPVEIGAMIETPAAVLNAVELAAACDFFLPEQTIMTQYVMAADRGNIAVSYLYDALSPSNEKSAGNDRGRSALAGLRRRSVANLLPIRGLRNCSSDSVSTACQSHSHKKMNNGHPPTALQFGAGNIGRGLVGAILAPAGYKVIFADVVNDLVGQINSRGEYTVHVLDINSYDIPVKGVSAVNSAGAEAVAKVSEADIITTAVSLRILKFVAPTIAKGIAARKDAGNEKPLNVIACENGLRASSQLKDLVYALLDSDTATWADNHVGFPDAAVDGYCYIPLRSASRCGGGRVFG